MILAESEGRRADALAYARKSAERLDAFLRRGDAKDFERREAATTYGNIALAYNNMHLYGEAVRYSQRSIALARSLPPGAELSSGLSVLANALRYQGDLEGALHAIQEARKIAEESAYANETLRMLTMYGILFREGLILGEDGGVNLDRPAEAIEALQRAFNITDEAARKSPNDYATRSRLASCAEMLGNILRRSDPVRALAVYDVAIRRLSEVQNNLRARRARAAALANSSYALRRLHRTSEAKQRIDAAFAILRDTKDYPADRIPFDQLGLYNTLVASADYEAEVGDPHRAIGIYEDLLDKVMASDPEPFTDLRNVPQLSRLYESLAGLYRRIGDAAKAESMESRRLELWRHWDRKLPHNAFVRRQLDVE
jgi:tetratricopeptide (TPR) repeat protein